MSKALDRALAGENVTGRAAETGLKEAAGKIDRMKGAMAKAKANAGAAISEAVHATEVIGSATATAALTGYLGEEGVKVKGWDLRKVVALGAGGVGLARTLMGKRDGKHAIAIGTGVAVAVAVPAAQKWGAEMGATKVNPDNATNASNADKAPVSGLREITVDDVGLTPPAVDKPRATERFLRVVPA